MNAPVRCEWAPAEDPLYLAYHDEEWGVPVRDERRLFEMLTLEGAQAGLSWSTILRKREGYRRAFAGFDPDVVAGFSDDDVERLLDDASIVRNRLKVRSAVENARAVIALRSESSLGTLLWSFVDDTPVDGRRERISDIPAETPESDAMSKELKRRGFRFVGPTVCYAFMQACGLVNDHVVSCFRYDEVRRQRSPRPLASDRGTPPRRRPLRWLPMATTVEPEGPRPAPWREVLRGRRGRLTTGLLLLEAMVGIEVLIVTTILPAVERDLGGLQLYGWAFSAYGLATLLTVPLGGRATDRFGPRPVLGIALGAFALGLVIASVAPSMAVVVAGRFVQGCGGGALYVVSVAAIAKAYPESLRPRVFALLTSMWILPGVIGPPLGALIASTIGWRWAFVLPVPVIAICLAMILPAMKEIRPEAEQRVDLPFRWPLQLTIGAAILLAGLTAPSAWTALAVVAGLAIGVPALLHVVPPGTLRAARGLPATAAAAFLTSTAFAAIDGFVPLMLTRVRGLSVGQAGLVVTGATITWCTGTFWQARRFERMGARRLVAIGGLLVAIAAVLVSGGLVEGFPVALPYIGWAIGGLGMGIAFPTIPLSAMTVATRGREAGDLSSTLLMDFLGISIGAGLAGASVALADAGLVSLRGGIAGAFAIGFVAAIALALVARRLPTGTSRTE